jgi:DNA-binding response OmpR family regulator
VARILLVEDDEDTLQLLALALRQKGHQVQEAMDGQLGLEAIRAGTFDLIVTDYDLPEKTGAQMLREAAAERLLRGASVLVVTAHPAPQGVEGLRLLAKPVEVDRFLKQVEHILEPRRGARRGDERPAPPSAVPETASPVEVTLYVGDNPASARARRNLETALGPFTPAQVRWRVVDAGRDPAAGERDHIVFLPTLVVKCGAPAWILGDLSAEGALADLLAMCGLAPPD